MERTELLVIGAGPAGLSAAAEATRHGIRTVVVDERPLAGGQFYARSGREPLAGLPDALLDGLDPELLDLRLEARAWGLFDDGVAVVHRGGSTVLRFDALVVATGAVERPQPFPGWDLEGVVAAGAAQLLVKESGVVPAGKVVIAGTGPFLLPVAAELLAAGADVRALIEARPRHTLMRALPALLRDPERVREAASYARALRRVPKRFGATIRAAGPGSLRLSTGESLEWDVLCVGHGFRPRSELAALAGCDVEDGAVRVGRDLRTSRGRVYAAGEATGIGGASLAAAEGRLAGLAVARDLGRWRLDSKARFHNADARRARLGRFAEALLRAFVLLPPLALATPETTLCRCEGVALGDVERARPFWVDGEGARAAKAVLRCGMGACQGTMCLEAVGAAAARRRQDGWSLPHVRPPLGAVSVREIAETE